MPEPIITRAIVVLCTAPDNNSARRLAQRVLEQKLAACVSLSSITSLYYWQEKQHQEPEIQLLCKSDQRHQQALLDCLKTHHPYDVPELLVLPVTHAGEHYLSWLTASLS